MTQQFNIPGECYQPKYLPPPQSRTGWFWVGMIGLGIAVGSFTAAMLLLTYW